MVDYRLGDLIDIASLQKLADAHYQASSVPIGLIDAIDNSILVGSGWQDICVHFHRANPSSLLRCVESDSFIKKNLAKDQACRYKCRNGLWDIGIPVIVGERHLATLFIGQFFIEGETPDRDFFTRLAGEYGFDLEAYLAALDRVPVFSQKKVEDILDYNRALARFIAKLAEHTLQMAEAEKMLRESEGKFHTIFDQATNLLGVCLTDGRIVEANQAALSLCGIGLAEVVGRPFWETPWWAHSPELQERLRRAIREAAEGHLVRFEATHLDVEGKPRFIDFSIWPVKDEHGRVFLLIPEGQDISERKMEEAERELLQGQLLEARKMESIGRLAGGVAHDFNNMLCVILNHAEILLDQVSQTDPFRENLQQIISAAERSATLTRQLLAFARRQVTSPQVLDLNKAVPSLLGMLRLVLGESVELNWRPAPEPCPIRIDPTQIDQVLLNLAANARDAIDGVGKVDLETLIMHADEAFCLANSGMEPGDYVLLKVSDSGCGMSQEVLQRIFEPFFTTKALGKGTGLGLATVYGIVQQNQGVIRVSSEQGKGTVFRIFLPRCSDLITESPGSSAEKPYSKGGETLLVVEDEPQVLDLTERLLTDLGYQVLRAATPQEAIRTAKDYPGEIDLLLSDVVMPEMDGWELARRLHAFRLGMKTLFMSGYPGPTEEGERGGFEEDPNILQKPFSLIKLATKVRQALDRG